MESCDRNMIYIFHLFRFIGDALNACSYFVNYQQSPMGRTHYLKWGSLRYASNTAFICLQASEITKDEDQARKFLSYALRFVKFQNF